MGEAFREPIPPIMLTFKGLFPVIQASWSKAASLHARSSRILPMSASACAQLVQWAARPWLTFSGAFTGMKNLYTRPSGHGW